MEEFKTTSGIIKIKEIVPLNTWNYPMEVGTRIYAIKAIIRNEKGNPEFLKSGNLFFKTLAFFNDEIESEKLNEQFLANDLWHKSGCTKIVSKKIILEEPFYDVSQDETLTYGIQIEGEYKISNNYLKMHKIPLKRTVAGRKGVRKKGVLNQH